MIKVSSAEELKAYINRERSMQSIETKPGEITVTIDYGWIIDQIIHRKGYICGDTLQVLSDLNKEQFEVR